MQKCDLFNTENPARAQQAGFFYAQDFLKTRKPKQMITIQHTEKQFEFHASFSTEGLHKLSIAIGKLFDFSNVKAIQKQKEQMLNDFGGSHFRIN